MYTCTYMYVCTMYIHVYVMYCTSMCTRSTCVRTVVPAVPSGKVLVLVLVLLVPVTVTVQLVP